MATPNTKVGNLKDLERRIRRLERANPLSSSSLGRGRMRFYDGSELLIQNGALNVTGTATISGVLNVSGQTNLSGQVSVTGPMNITGTTTIGGNTSITGELVVTGPTTLDGITDIGGDTTITGVLDVQGNTTISGDLSVTGPMSTEGALDVKGVTTLQADLNVENNGKIIAGMVEIWPDNIALEDATITSSTAFGVRMAGSQRDAVVQSYGARAALEADGSIVAARAGKIDLTAPTTAVSGLLTAGNGLDVTGRVRFLSLATASSTYTANVYIDANGRLWKTA